MLVVYNLLVIPFALGLYFSLKKGITRILVLAALALTAICGTVVTVFLPLRCKWSICNITGMMHLVVVGFVVPCTFVFMLGFWNSVRKDVRWGMLGMFSLVIFLVTLISGITTAASVNSDYRGLLERITIGSTLLWIEVVSVKLYFIAKCNFKHIPKLARACKL